MHFSSTSSHRIRKLPLAAIGVVACIFIGCGDANRGKIIGTWQIQRADSVLKRIDSEKHGAATQAHADETNPPKMLLTFERSGALKTTTRMGAVDQAKEGTWTFDSFDMASNKLHMTCLLQNQESQHVVHFIDQDTIKLVPPNMAGTKLKIEFTRQQ